MIRKIDPSIIPYDNLIRALCKTPYYGHPKGCTNYGKKKGCPPGQEIITDIFDFDKELYVIATEFPIGKFAERMRKAHPDWKESIYPDQPKKTPVYVQEIRERMKIKHPNWSEEYFAPTQIQEWESARNWYNPRRWQGTARKKHRVELEKFASKHPELTIERNPEAHGINLTGLMSKIGIELKWQWPPVHEIKNKSQIISIAGHLK